MIVLKFGEELFFWGGGGGVGVHTGVVYDGAYGKVERFLASLFTFRLEWGVESGSGMIIVVEISHWKEHSRIYLSWLLIGGIYGGYGSEPRSGGRVELGYMVPTWF